jgi:hypothetical protein
VRWVGGLDRSENDNVRIRHMLVDQIVQPASSRSTMET